MRAGIALNSPQLPQVLSTGALIEELSLSGHRLQYKRRSGIGPDEGCVSISCAGNRLVVKTQKVPLSDVGMLFYQSLSDLRTCRVAKASSH